MTSDKDTNTVTLLEPITDDAPTAGREPEPRRGNRLFWLLAGLIVAALALLGVWTFALSRTVDQVVDVSRVSSDHDSVVDQLVRERKSSSQAAAVEHDAWVLGSRGTRGAEAQTGDTQHDSSINLRMRSNAADTGGCARPAPAAGGWEARLAVGC